MINVSSKITINSAKLKQLNQAAIRSLEQTAEALHTDVIQAQVIPRDTGALQDEAMFVDKSQSSRGKVSIVHSTPYARRLYFHPEYNFNKSENPNAGGRWFDPYLPGGEKADFCGKAFKRFYRRNGGV